MSNCKIARPALAAVAVLAAAILPAQAQTFPSRQILLIVPYAAGGTGDIVGRMIAEKLSVTLGQSVIVENRAGATGSIGTRAVVTAAPDGHTLLLGQTGEIAITPNWGKGTGYHPDKDLEPVALATLVRRPMSPLGFSHFPYESAISTAMGHRT